VLIENAGASMNLLQDLWSDMPRGMTRPIGIKPEGSKIDRMAAQSAKIETGHVLLNDDQVDSVSQFLYWFQQRAFQHVPFALPIVFSTPREFLY